MNCEHARERMMEWMDGRLPPSLANDLKAHVDTCPACQAELAATRRMAALLDAPSQVRPSPRLRESVYAAIAAEQGVPTKGAQPGRPTLEGYRRRTPWFVFLQAAGACVLIAVGYFAGHRSAPAALPSGASPVAAPAAGNVASPSDNSAATRQEVADLRARLDSMGQLVGYTLQQQQRSSTNQRLETVLNTAAEAKPDQHAIDTLISALALDPSVNVRLSAVQGLYAHADLEVVRTAVAISLPRETSPLVQLAMIDFLTAAKDTAAAPILDKLSTNAAADASVRDAAGRALALLRRNHF